MSHDLRNPLSTIRAASTDLLAGVHTDEARRAELLGLVVSESERLDRIVGNLLSVGRAHAGQLVPAKAPAAARRRSSCRRSRRLERLGTPPIVLDLDPTAPRAHGRRRPARPGDRQPRRERRPGQPARRVRHASPPAARGDLVEVMVSDHGPGSHPRSDATRSRRSGRPAGRPGSGWRCARRSSRPTAARIDIVDDGTTGSTVRFTLPLGGTSPGRSHRRSRRRRVRHVTAVSPVDAPERCRTCSASTCGCGPSASTQAVHGRPAALTTRSVRSAPPPASPAADPRTEVGGLVTPIGRRRRRCAGRRRHRRVPAARARTHRPASRRSSTRS